MSGQITEVAFLPLQPNLDLTSGDVKAVWDDTLQTIASQPGCQSLFWGRQIEKPDVVQLVIGEFVYPCCHLYAYRVTCAV